MSASRTIRSATPEDVPLVLAFICELADYERLAHEVVATEESLHRWLFGPGAVAEVLVAEDDGQPVGFALFFRSFSTFLGRPGIWLEDLFVRPEHRGGGHGRALLAELAKLTASRGYGRLEWSVLDWNEPAIGFYRALGAVSMDDWTTFRLTGENLDCLARSSTE
jgi:GNAT superfamily N-acetyltransferase